MTEFLRADQLQPGQVILDDRFTWRVDRVESIYEGTAVRVWGTYLSALDEGLVGTRRRHHYPHFARAHVERDAA